MAFSSKQYTNGRGPVLNPSIPPFHPTGTEVELHSPSSYTDPRKTQFKDMRNWILQSNTHVTRELIELEHRTQMNTEDIKSMTETFRCDLQSLQSMIYELQGQIVTSDVAKKDGHTSPNEDEDDLLKLMRAHRAGRSITPTQAAWGLTDDKEALADAYMRLADDADEFPAKLREIAYDILESEAHGSSIAPKNPGRVCETLANTPDEGMSIPDVDAAKPARITVNHAKTGTPKDHNEQPPWIPRAVREMPQYQRAIPATSETFTWNFITSLLGGMEWSPGYYFVAKNSIIQSRGYWILEAESEPFLPESPGHNGAKLTTFFNETLTESGEVPAPENYKYTPVFIRPQGKDEYVYFGEYSQTRYSDKLDYDRVTTTVSKQVRASHAEKLADARRPPWVTQALMQNFWPKPEYTGPLPQVADDEQTKKKISEALWEYAEDVAAWDREARMKASLLNPTALMQAFEHADTDEEPGLRMYWEYMQCVGYDTEFFKFLHQRKSNPTVAKSSPPNTATEALNPEENPDQEKPKKKAVTKASDSRSTPETKVKSHEDPARRFRELAALKKGNTPGKSIRA